MTDGQTRVRVLSNLEGLAHASQPGFDIEVHPWPRGGRLMPFRLFFASSKYDYVLLNGKPRELMVFGALKRLLPFTRCRFVGLDILLSAPRSASGRVKCWLRGFALSGLHRILLYYKDTSAIQRVFGIPADRFDYVPFKINQIDLVQSAAVRDEGYIFCGGKTRRDFRTFIDAVTPLPHKVKIVTTANEDIARHGSYLDDAPIPPHIERIRLDGSAPPFIDLMAGARVVVLPLKPDVTGVGIGVYIMAMALGKPVVISQGPSTEGLLSEGLAVVVPPGDVERLREAIRRVVDDDGLRRRLSENGRRYATSLGGEQQLMASVADWLRRDAGAAR